MGVKSDALAKRFEGKIQEPMATLEKLEDGDWKKLRGQRMNLTQGKETAWPGRSGRERKKLLSLFHSSIL